MIPQYKVNKGKILCGDYLTSISTDQEDEKLKIKLQNFSGFKDIGTYCQNL
tara:strand:- start:276 stop:428 length:153 start_codon:yes stop_codon:yes gene_type:complete